jgi:hypothetical protein
MVNDTLTIVLRQTPFHALASLNAERTLSLAMGLPDGWPPSPQWRCSPLLLKHGASNQGLEPTR